jgi:hypothetical protein
MKKVWEEELVAIDAHGNKIPGIDLVTVDFKMKVLPFFARETQSQSFGQRGDPHLC